MDDFMDNRVDYDYYVEDESGDERNQWRFVLTEMVRPIVIYVYFTIYRLKIFAPRCCWGHRQKILVPVN